MAKQRFKDIEEKMEKVICNWPDCKKWGVDWCKTCNEVKSYLLSEYQKMQILVTTHGLAEIVQLAKTTALAQVIAIGRKLANVIQQMKRNTIFRLGKKVSHKGLDRMTSFDYAPLYVD